MDKDSEKSIVCSKSNFMHQILWHIPCFGQG